MISVYAYNVNRNRGIAASVNSVQKIRDGEPLGGSARAEDDFEAYEDEDEDDDFLS